MVRFNGLALAFAVVLAAVPAYAQYGGYSYTNSYGYTFNNPVSATANAIFWNNMNQRMMYRVLLARRGYTEAQIDQMSSGEMEALLKGGTKNPPAKASTPEAPAAPKLQLGASRFKPAKKRLLVGPIAKALTKDKAQQKALMELFELGLGAYEKEAKSVGLDHDVAGAMAFFIGVAYMIHHDGAEPDENGLELFAKALQAQLATKEMARMSSADKQKFYELMIVLGTYLAAGYQQAQNDGDTQTASTLKQAAGEALKGFLHIEPDKLVFTANGVEIKN